MNATLHSKDDYKENSRGKTSRVWSDSPGYEIRGSTLVVTAMCSDYYCPNDLGVFGSSTPPRDIQRRLAIEFTPEDLQRLLDTALKAGLIEVTLGVKQQ
jgi:hypothetical protein